MNIVAPNKAFASKIRTVLAALLVGSCLAAADLASAQVADPQYRFCIQGDDECVANPWYTGEREKTSISEPVTDPLDRE